MYTLYGGGFDRSHMTAMALTEIGARYEFEIVDTIKGEHRAPAFLAINPAGWIPALRTPEGEILYETPAINLHLCERHAEAGLVPLAGEADRGAFLSALFYITGEFEPALKRFFFPHRYCVRAEGEDAARDMAVTAMQGRLAVIDDRLAARGPFHLGDRYSLADLTLAYWIGTIRTRVDIERFAAVRRCWRLVSDRPKLDAPEA